MNIPEAFDLMASFRDAGELAGCSLTPPPIGSPSVTPATCPTMGRSAGSGSSNPFLSKIEEWVERSDGKVRADVAFDKLRGAGVRRSERTVRRAVAEVKANHRRGRRRVYRPWIPEPGMWAQWDGAPARALAGGRRCCSGSAGLVPALGGDPDVGPHHADVIGCLDRAMRTWGAPTYWLPTTSGR